MRYERKAAERYSQYAKMLRLIATYDDYEPTQRAILKIASGYERMAALGLEIDQPLGQPDEQRLS